MATSSLKRHNHRVHPCPTEKKEALLHLLLAQNDTKKIIVVSSQSLELTTQQTNVSIVSDKELYNTPDLRCELLISYDLPEQAIVYMSRISKSDSHALILMDAQEEQLLHPIERLNGRTIMQEMIEDFSPIREEKIAQPSRKDADPREERKQAFLAQNEDVSKEDTDKKPWEKRDKKENTYLGKDDKGKGKFSGKSGERNHRFDGKPKGKSPKLTGKTISIKGKAKKDAL